jgi:23S rRNA (guanosine2251-2'-O)-methyltransferase
VNRPGGRERVRQSAPRAPIYGRNPVREALRGRRGVRRVWASAPVLGEPWLGGAAVVEAARAELEALCGSPHHQGVCAEVDAFPYADAAGLLAGPEALVVCLDQVQDPGNLGAVCRTAECAGAAGLVIPSRRSADVTPAVCRASAGAVEHLPLARVRNLADFLLEARGRGAWVYGASAGAATPYGCPDYSGRVVLVLGGVERGLRPRVAAACDELVALPLRGRVESLSVSAAAAALLYGILQERERVVDKEG